MRYLTFFFALGLVLSSCRKDNISTPTFVSYSLNGASCNGLFRIDDDGDPLTMEGTALILPETNDVPEIIILTLYDYVAEREVAFQIPAKEGTFLLTYDSDHFGMGIIDSGNDWLLVSGVENTVLGVSVDVQKFKRGTNLLIFNGVEELKLHFVGIMTYENEMNEVEQHTVEGDLFFNGTF